LGVETGRRHKRGRRGRPSRVNGVVRSELRLRRAGSVVEIAAVVALAEEYGAWAVNVAKSEYGIDAQAESEHGLSTSIDELLQPRGRLSSRRSTVCP
jgi:hypothetical protein